MKAIQEELALFPAPSFEEICRHQGHEKIAVILNARMRTRWQVTLHPLSGRRTLEVPSLLAEAPEQVKTALIAWALLPVRRRKNQRATPQDRRELERTIWDWIGSRRGHLDKKRHFIADQAAWKTTGSTYDLQEVFQSINHRYFNNSVHSIVRWGAHASLTSYQTFRRDREGNRVSLITIAGVYDHPAVPRFAIEGVVFHEALHVVVPCITRGGRRVVHGAEFKRAERAYPGFELWRKWEREELLSLARALRRKHTLTRHKI
jgi:hypothetical protein